MKYRVHTGYSTTVCKAKRQIDAREIARALSAGYKRRTYTVYHGKTIDSMYLNGERVI